MADPRRPDDELVSAVLDGDADEAARRRVAADPELTARLAEFGAVRDRVAAPVAPPDPETSDAMIARAVAAGSRAATAPGPAVVADLDRTRRQRRSVAGRRVLALAAVVGILALAGGLVAGLRSDRDEAADQATGSADPARAGGVEVPDLALGAVADPDELARRVAAETGLDDTALRAPPGDAAESGAGDGDQAVPADRVPSEEGAEPPAGVVDGTGGGAGRSVEDCAVALVESRPRLIGQLAQGTLTYQGTEAYVLVYNDADATGPVAIVTAVADCTVLAEVTI